MIVGDACEPKWRIGFYTGPPQIRMEEEEGPYEPPQRTLPKGAATGLDPETLSSLMDYITQERLKIIGAMDLPNVPVEGKFKLLEENRLFMNSLRGESTTKFRTEKVIYSILIFSGTVIVVLAMLTSFADLPKEVTITFVGTVVGGTIATIAQKLGKIGR